MIIVLVLLAAMAFIGPDSLAGLMKSSRSAAPETDALPNVLGQPEGTTGKNVLVAYFSWGGNTRAAAKTIHGKTGGDLAERKRLTK